MIPVVLVLAAAVAIPDAKQNIDCDQVRALVAQHGRAKALAWALRQGVPLGQIRAAAKCLEPTANNGAKP